MQPKILILLLAALVGCAGATTGYKSFTSRSYEPKQQAAIAVDIPSKPYSIIGYVGVEHEMATPGVSEAGLLALGEEAAKYGADAVALDSLVVITLIIRQGHSTLVLTTPPESYYPYETGRSTVNYLMGYALRWADTWDRSAHAAGTDPRRVGAALKHK